MKEFFEYQHMISSPFEASLFNKRKLPDHPVLSKVGKVFFDTSDLNYDCLNSKLADVEVVPLVGLPNSGSLKKEQQTYEEPMTFNAFVKLVFSNPKLPCYLAYLRPSDLDSKLAAEIDFSSFKLPDTKDTDTRLWLGSKGTNSGLHSDLKNNIFIQVVGKKTLFLAPPQDTRFLYPFKDNIVNSQIDLPELNFSRFPKARKARIWKNEIGPGDVVFIPKGWWHCLISTEPSISVNHWFGTPMECKWYIRLIMAQGFSYMMTTLIDAFKYGIFKMSPKKDFFFTPPPNGARLFDYLMTGNFSKENDPVL